MSALRAKDAAEIRAEIEQIERVSKAIQTALWVIAAGSLVWTATTVTHLAVHHGAPKEIAWILSPLVECALIAVLLGDGILSSYGQSASGWAIALRWFAGLSSWLMNVWDSFGFHAHRHHLAASPDAPGLLIHSIVPALLILLAEVAPRYRRQFAVIAERLRGHLAEIEPSAVQVTPGSVAQATAHVTREVTSEVTAQATATPLTQGTPQATDPVTVEVTDQATPATGRKSPTKARGKAAPKSRRTDADLIADLEKLVAAHYREHPGEEVKVQPIAKQLGIGRDRARLLLDQMNVRPIRREATG